MEVKMRRILAASIVGSFDMEVAAKWMLSRRL